MQRVLACAERGFPSVVFDWVDDFGDNNGLGLTTADYRAYLLWLTGVARGMGMTVGTMNGASVLSDPTQVPPLDFGITQDCVTQNNCPVYAAVHGGWGCGHCTGGLGTEEATSMDPQHICCVQPTAQSTFECILFHPSGGQGVDC